MSAALLPIRKMATGHAHRPPRMLVPNTSPTTVAIRFLVLWYARPHSSAPNILPGKAIRLPRPSRLRSREATKATPTPHQGPSRTAHSTLTMCCTGAHLLPNMGKLNTLPTTHRAQNIPARASFLTERFFMINWLLFNHLRQRRMNTGAPATKQPVPTTRREQVRKVRSKLTGFLSRRNTASHRIQNPRLRALPLSRLRNLRRGTKKQEEPGAAPPAKNHKGYDFLRRHYPHQVKGSKLAILPLSPLHELPCV